MQQALTTFGLHVLQEDFSDGSVLERRIRDTVATMREVSQLTIDFVLADLFFETELLTGMVFSTPLCLCGFTTRSQRSRMCCLPLTHSLIHSLTHTHTGTST